MHSRALEILKNKGWAWVKETVTEDCVIIKVANQDQKYVVNGVSRPDCLNAVLDSENCPAYREVCTVEYIVRHS